MHASMEGLGAACEHPGTTIQMDTEAEGLAEEPEWCVMLAMGASTVGLVVAHGQYQDFIICSLWMPQQMDLLLHMDIVKIVQVYVCSLWMPQQMDLLLHMDIVVIYVVVVSYVPDLLWRQQSKL